MDRHPVLVDFLAVIALAGVTVGPESKWHAEGLNTPRWWLVGTGNGRSFTPLIQATGRIVVR